MFLQTNLRVDTIIIKDMMNLKTYFAKILKEKEETT